uniref:Uncharacterized protein n=1 Tax=uncultured Oceanospirillales bacterium HF0130_06B06 TaxID=723619 RepID=E7C2C3_9GAMM|nr:hypothetical protein [uncultured Oceanospirillales bacterium HF0130_06B06]
MTATMGDERSLEASFSMLFAAAGASGLVLKGTKRPNAIGFMIILTAYKLGLTTINTTIATRSMTGSSLKTRKNMWPLYLGSSLSLII